MLRSKRAITQLGVLAGAHQQHRAFRNLAKASAIAEAAITGQHQHFAPASGIVQFLTQLLAHLHKAARQVLLFGRFPILLVHLFGGSLGWPFDARDFLKANR